MLYIHKYAYILISESTVKISTKTSASESTVKISTSTSAKPEAKDLGKQNVQQKIIDL